MCDGQLHRHTVLQRPEVVVEEVSHDHQVAQLREQHDAAWERGSGVVRQLSEHQEVWTRDGGREERGQWVRESWVEEG